MSIEAVRAFWNSRPCNARHSEVSIDEDALAYSRAVTERKYFVEPHILGFAEHDKWAGRRILELGCGIGTDAIEFARDGAIVHAVDISGKSVEIARKRSSAEGQPIHFFVANAESVDFAEKDYDLVYSFGVIHHTPDPVRVVRNAYRHLKSGGEFRMMVYNRLSWKAFWILVTYGKGRFWRWKELIPRHSEAQNGCPITRTYTKSSARELLESNGFSVEEISVDHIFPYRISDYIQRRYTREWYWRLIPKQFFGWLERRVGWHILVKARRKDCKR